MEKKQYRCPACGACVYSDEENPRCGKCGAYVKKQETAKESWAEFRREKNDAIAMRLSTVEIELNSIQSGVTFLVIVTVIGIIAGIVLSIVSCNAMDDLQSSLGRLLR